MSDCMVSDFTALTASPSEWLQGTSSPSGDMGKEESSGGRSNSVSVSPFPTRIATGTIGEGTSPDEATKAGSVPSERATGDDALMIATGVGVAEPATSSRRS